LNQELAVSRSNSWKWWVTGLLLLATMINYMDRVTLSGASVRITQELHLTDEEYGHLELAFGWAFAVGSLTFGFLVDRLPVYYLYPAILAAWSLMGMATAWSHHFWDLVLCRTLLGFFEAGHWPCALKMTLGLLEEKERTLGNSILQGGASIGAIITPQIMKFMMTEESGSWRHPFIAVGAAGLLWVVLWFLCLRSRDLERTRTPVPQQDAPGLAPILHSGRFWALALLVVGIQPVWQIYRAWLMKFLQTGRGYTEHAALDFLSTYYIATDTGCILAGLICVWIIRRGRMAPHEARRSVFTGACVLTSLCVFLPWLGRGWPLLGTLLLIGAGALALFPCYYSFLQEISATHLGRVTGLLSLWVWAVTSPMHSFFGILADRTKSYDLGLVIAGLTPWLGVFALAFIWRKDSSSDAAR
jgi:ACS family hexuronate transporter-like MFS transporter